MLCGVFGDWVFVFYLWLWVGGFYFVVLLLYDYGVCFDVGKEKFVCLL